MNSQHIFPKIDDGEITSKQHRSLDILGFLETFISEDIDDIELVIRGFRLGRKDKQHKTDVVYWFIGDLVSDVEKTSKLVALNQYG